MDDTHTWIYYYFFFPPSKLRPYKQSRAVLNKKKLNKVKNSQLEQILYMKANLGKHKSQDSL